MSELLHEKRGLTTEMASRVSKVAGGSPESWLRMQEALDIRQAEMMKNKGTRTLFRKTKGHSLRFAAEIIAKQSEFPFVELLCFAAEIIAKQSECPFVELSRSRDKRETK